MSNPVISFEWPGDWTVYDTERMAYNHGRHLLAEGITLA